MNEHSYRLGLMHGALLVAIVLLIFVVAHAQVSLSVFGISKHSDSGYCEFNPGLALNYEISKELRALAGRYENSKCRMTNVAGFAYCPIHVGAFCFGTAFLRLTSYGPNPIYAPLPIASYDAKSYALEFVGAKHKEEWVLGAGIRFPL